MSKSIKFKNSVYLDSSGVWHNNQELKNYLNLHTGGITLGGGNDKTSTSTISWSAVKFSFSNVMSNTNPNLFEYYNGGVRIKAGGYYLISFTLNMDFTGQGASACLFINDNQTIINDVGVANSMTNLTLSPVIVYVNSGSVIYAGWRCEIASSHLTRQARSSLTVTAL